MKQEPSLPSINVAVKSALPQRMMVFSEIKKNGYILGGGIVAVTICLLCLLITFWFMNIPKQEIRLHSTIEVAFQAPELLSVPEESPKLSEDTESKEVIEPNMVSELLPEHEEIASIPIVKPQQHVVQPKKDMSLSKSVEKVSQTNLATHTQQKGQQSSKPISSSKQAIKTISVAQRCSALSNEYPTAARRRHEQGTVKIQYQLLPNGKISQAEIIETSGFADLDRAALHAVKGMKCQAALEQPVINANIPVNFSLNKNN